MTTSVYGPQEASGVWVYLEQEDGQFLGVTRELLGKGRELADALHAPLTGLLVGHEVGALAREAFALGADEVLLAEHPLLAYYTTDGHAKVVMQAVLEHKPDVLLFGATTNGRDLAGRLAVRFRTGLTADCTDLAIEAETGLLLGEVVGFGGGVVATIKCASHRPQMATARPGVFPPPAATRPEDGRLTRLRVSLAEEDLRLKVIERVPRVASGVTEAEILVVGGRGVGSDFSLLYELAGLIGGKVGATRVAVDNGWATHEQQIGQTGVIARPRIAIVLGASGALQFTVGIDAAETIVAVNADDEAPMLESADYCAVDDVFQILPPLIREIRTAR